MLAGLITNGYRLTPERIKLLNQAGLDHLQISIDNVKPDDVSKKSLRVLDKKIRLLAEHAQFDVNVNSVIGSSIQTPEDALVITRYALDLGLSSTMGLLHNDSGCLKPLSDKQRSRLSANREVEKTIPYLGTLQPFPQESCSRVTK